MWPSYFPDACPPDDAISASLTVYRAVLNVPPTKEDFLPQKAMKPKVWYGNNTCFFCSVSLFTDYNEAVVASQSIKSRSGNYKIAKGTTDPNKGVVLCSSTSSHVDYWVYTGITIHSGFTIVTKSEGQSCDDV